jgi:putative transposase
MLLRRSPQNPCYVAILAAEDSLRPTVPSALGFHVTNTVIDIASRRVVGYALADHLRTELVSDALVNAVAVRDPAAGVIFHADRGCQYTSAAFAALAGDCQVTLSHGRTGQCWDNALSESFFASLKGELIDLQPWPTQDMARRAIVEYIAWYNGTRLHSTLGYRSPAEFEEDNKIKKVA